MLGSRTQRGQLVVTHQGHKVLQQRAGVALPLRRRRGGHHFHVGGPERRLPGRLQPAGDPHEVTDQRALAQPEEMFARAERREQRRRDGAIGSIAQGVDRRGQRVRQLAGAATFNGQRGWSAC